MQSEFSRISIPIEMLTSYDQGLGTRETIFRAGTAHLWAIYCEQCIHLSLAVRGGVFALG